MSINMSALRNKFNLKKFFSFSTIVNAFKGLFSGYDLPLSQETDTKFLLLLVTLMVFLAVLALSGSFALHDMSERWSSGLEDKVTIEIPIETKDGHLLSQETVQKETVKIKDALEKHPFVKSARALKNEEISNLIDPWIGESLLLTEIPLPGLIALEFKDNVSVNIEEFRQELAQMSRYAHLEDHQEWLGQLIDFANILQNLSLIISVIIISTTITAIIAAVRARLAIHKKEVELLHLIGAPDSYIAKQFQRHMAVIAFKGAIFGTFVGLLAVFIITLFSQLLENSLIPSLEISFTSFLFLLSFPLFFPAIASLTAYQTVLRSLRNMP